MGLAQALEPMDEDTVRFPTSRRKRSALPHGQVSMHAHSGRLHGSRKAGNALQRDIALTLASYNIGAVAEKSYTNGVIAFAGKAYMFAD